MRALLDTHIAVWWIAGDGRLGAAAHRIIADPENEMVVSIASLWEISIKNGLNRSAGSSFGISVADAATAFAEADFVTLPIAQRHLLEIENLPRNHGDPFDRMLIAQAKADGYRLVTHDRAFRDYGDFVIVV